MLVAEPEFDFKQKISDVDVYEKETAVFECVVNDAEASVKWFKDNKVLTKLYLLRTSIEFVLIRVRCNTSALFSSIDSVKLHYVVKIYLL